MITPLGFTDDDSWIIPALAARKATGGEGEDMGLKFNLLGGRVIGTLAIARRQKPIRTARRSRRRRRHLQRAAHSLYRDWRAGRDRLNLARHRARPDRQPYAELAPAARRSAIALRLFSNYTFMADRLRGFSAGLGVKVRGPQVAGLNAAQTLAWRGSHPLFDASLGYSRKFFGLKNATKLQLNVTNLFDNDTLLPTLSDGVIDYRWQYLRPRTISLTTTIRF